MEVYGPVYLKMAAVALLRYAKAAKYLCVGSARHAYAAHKDFIHGTALKEIREYH